MPKRLIRDWTDSEKFEALSAEAERLFVRLIQKADDFGRFHANPKLMKSACFPLAEDLRANTVAAWLTELSDRHLVFCYTSGTGQYLAIINYRQRLKKESTPKFPPAPGRPEKWLPDEQDPGSICEIPHISGNFPELPGNGGKLPENPGRSEKREAGSEKREAGSGSEQNAAAAIQQSILSAINRTTDYLSAEEQEIARELVSEGCLVGDFESAFQATVARGKPNRSLKYLRNMVRDARDARTNPKLKPKVKGAAHDLAGKDYGESQLPPGWLDENDSTV